MFHERRILAKLAEIFNGVGTSNACLLGIDRKMVTGSSQGYIHAIGSFAGDKSVVPSHCFF